MNAFREQQWPARVPSANFAERAVDTLLANARRPKPSRRGSRTMLYLALAALFASGSALAWSHYHHGRVSTPVAGVAQLSPAPTQSTALPVSPVSPTVASCTPTIERKAATAATNRPTKSQQKAVKPSLQRRTPPCECERGFSDFICDCY